MTGSDASALALTWLPGLALHAGVLAAALAVLRAVHARPGRLRDVFDRAHRPALLRWLHPLWAAALVTVVAVAWWRRAALAWIDPLPAALLVLQTGLEALLTAHWLGFVWHGWRGLTPAVTSRGLAPQLAQPVEVLVLVPSADEDEAVLTRSVSSLARLRGGRVVLVDNSRSEAGRMVARRLAARHAVELLEVAPRGSKAAALADALAALPHTPLLAVFDADQQVAPEFLERTAPLLLAADDLAFVQTPQAYRDAGQSLVGRAAAQQEMLQYDCVLPSKHHSGWVRCCGTGFVMRRDALDAVGGFDEDCVAEDLATGHALHVAGWRSAYLREVLAEGLAPTDLHAWWRQQDRWATASAQVLRRLLLHPGHGGWRLWADTLWSVGFYPVVVLVPVLAALPLLAALLGPHAAPIALGAALGLLPLYALVVALPYATMGLRGYAPRDLLLLQGLLTLTGPRYLVALVRGLAGGAAPFRSTRGAAPSGAPALPLWSWLAVAVLGGLALVHLLTVPTPASAAVYLGLLAYTVTTAQLFLFADYWPTRSSSARTAAGSVPAAQPALRTRQ